jgi:hypothetical protein
MPVTGIITINGVKYPIQDFTINWTNNLEPFWYTGDPTIHFYGEETEEQRDKRLNPRKYDSCKFCFHKRREHQLGYGKCNDVDIDYIGYGDEHKIDTECECKEFV